MKRDDMSSRSSGASLVEVLVVVLIMGIVSSAAFAMMCATMQAGRTLENKVDSVSNARNAIDTFTRDMRMGRSIGDVYGDLISMGYNDPTTGQPVTAVQGSSVFPGTNDPLYGNGAPAPAGGWPTWADGSAPTTFTCDNQTCIVQVPIFDGNGFPQSIPANTGNGSVTWTRATDNVETHIYRVVPDPQNNGEFILQYVILPGWNQPAGTQRGPITLAKAIIGPRNPQTGLPRTFQYLDKHDTSGIARDTPLIIGSATNGNVSEPSNGAWISRFSGVVLNLEIRRHDASDQQRERKALALKSEIFLRNNSMTLR